MAAMKLSMAVVVMAYMAADSLSDAGTLEMRNCTQSLIVENDTLLFTDKNYTSGIFIAGYCDAEDDGDQWLKPLKLLHPNGYTLVGYSVYAGFSLYTPEDLAKTELARGDGRPYSSIVILGRSEFLAVDPNKIAFKYQFQLAALGLDWGSDAQKWLHRVMKVRSPEAGQLKSLTEASLPFFTPCSGNITSAKILLIWIVQEISGPA